MVSGKTFHVMAGVYAVFDLILSSGSAWQCYLDYQTERKDNDSMIIQREDGEDSMDSTLLLVSLIVQVVALVVSVLLLVGVFMKVLQLVKAYKIYFIVRIILYVILGCFLAVDAGQWWFVVVIVYVIIGLPLFALIIWILNGEIRFLEDEQMNQYANLA